MAAEQVPAGTQQIGVGDTEVLSVDDPGGVPGGLTDEAPDAASDSDSAFDDAFSGGAEPVAESEPGPEEQPGGEGDQQPAPTPPVVPEDSVESPRPEWLPVEIDHRTMDEAELLRLQIVHNSAQAANQLPAEEQALLGRYRQARNDLDAHSGAPAAQQVAPYQPRMLDVPDGYETDAAIRGLVDSINRQTGETAHLINTQASQMAQLGQAVQLTSDQAMQASQGSQWQGFLTEHPEALDPAVQEKMATEMDFWRNPNTDLRQKWSAVLAHTLPAKAPAQAAKAPMDPATQRARKTRAMAAAAAHPPARTVQPGEQDASVDDLDNVVDDFGADFRREFPNG